MIEVSFIGQEYCSDQQFRSTWYNFCGNVERGWNIYRLETNHLTEEPIKKLVLQIGPGHTLIKTKYCGICSTDLNRHFLPFDLPQIIGHEVSGWEIGKSKEISSKTIFTAEINDSHLSRSPYQQNETSNCTYCSCVNEEGMDRHCPERLTLGIDRLPGGFAPFLLAPVGSIIEIPKELSLKCATLAEPFSAALQVISSFFYYILQILN